MFDLTSKILYHLIERNATVFFEFRNNFERVMILATMRTIRQVAALGILSEHYLRIRQRQGKLPGIFAGNRFLVDVDALSEMLRAESAAAVRQEAKK